MKTRAYDLTPAWAHVVKVTTTERAVAEIRKLSDWWVGSLPTDVVMLMVIYLVLRHKRWR